VSAPVPGLRSATGLRLAAPAKLNLSLAVTGRRGDGRHELVGVMVLLELADELRLLPGVAGLQVEGSEPDLAMPAQPANLAWRGLTAGLATVAPEACLVLGKRIPVAAGLGGGSSDAAAAWRLGRRMRGAQERATDEELADLADLGADVPFFAAQVAAARVSGIGERIEQVAVPADAPREVVLAHPPFGLSTAAVFGELRAADWTGAAAGDEHRSYAGGAVVAPGRNDLLAPARRLRPEITELERLMVAAGTQPRMTGSGPTMFALVDHPEHADAIAARLERGGVRTTRTRLRDQAASIEPIEGVSQKEAG
jgi:4-diphosphocytidyl-2-C-methyl-D-erythritol kinase